MNPGLRYLSYLVAIAASFGVGLLVFSPRVERPTAVADSAPTLPRQVLACATPTDGNCLPGLPGRDIQVITPSGAPSSPVTAAATPDNKPVEQPTAAKPAATALAPEAAPPAPTAVPQEPAAPTAPTAVTTAPTPAPAPQAKPQRRPAIADIKPEEPASKRMPRRERTAKRPASEAMQAVRRFGDDLRDIPVSSYAADGSRRNIVIRPTNIQDVYYYSVPR